MNKVEVAVSECLLEFYWIVYSLLHSVVSLGNLHLGGSVNVLHPAVILLNMFLSQTETQVS